MECSDKYFGNSFPFLGYNLISYGGQNVPPHFHNLSIANATISARSFRPDMEMLGENPGALNIQQACLKSGDAVLSHAKILPNCVPIANPSLFAEFRP
jgi:hypothetical protein